MPAWHDTVVCLSVCLSVYRVGVEVKSCTTVFLAGHFLFTSSSDTFAVNVSFSHKNMDRLKSKSTLQFETVSVNK